MLLPREKMLGLILAPIWPKLEEATDPLWAGYAGAPVSVTCLSSA
jgi:hypothetical protein